MNLCIFCDTELTPETNPEHILLNALGGRKTTRRAICSSHNNKFGATIDKAITDQVAAFRNLLKLDSGTGKPPPLMRIENTGGERLILHPDGKPDLVQKPFVFTPRPEGGFDIEINARDEAELTRIIPNVAAALGASESSVWDQLAQNGTGSWRSRRAGTVHHELALGGEGSLRSICKAAFCLIAANVGTDSLRTPAFSSARDFVVSGGAEFNRERGSLDPRTLPVSDLLEERFGPLFNLIYVRSDLAGRVVAHFTLYNLIAWQAVLAEAGGRLTSIWRSPQTRWSPANGPTGSCLRPKCLSPGSTLLTDQTFSRRRPPGSPKPYRSGRSEAGPSLRPIL